MKANSIYIDCSPMLAAMLSEIEKPDGMIVFNGDPSPPVLAAMVRDAAIVLNGHTVMDNQLLAASPLLKSIVFLGTGASSYVDLAEAERRGIRVRTVKGYGDRTVAEHTFALLLAAVRDIAIMDRKLRAGEWHVAAGLELKGATLGLIGLGGVGSEMARIASGFGMRVLAWNRSGVPAGLPVEAADLDTVLASSDIVSLHLALVPETKGLINAERFARMKKGVILVNTARGAVVDEAAMIDALSRGHIAHAALDVFETEPLPAGHALTKLANVTLTAHAAWKTEAATRRLLLRSLDLVRADAERLRAGQSLSE